MTDTPQQHCCGSYAEQQQLLQWQHTAAGGRDRKATTGERGRVAAAGKRGKERVQAPKPKLQHFHLKHLQRPLPLKT